MRNFVSNRVQSVPPSGIRRFFDIAATMKNVISLGIGEPDFVTPAPILQAGRASLERGETGYTSNSGIWELRVALDHLAQHGRWVTWGPGRHAMAQNLFAYVRMPEEELFVELYSDMEQLQADHRPRRFPDDPHASNAWANCLLVRTSASCANME